MPVLDLLLERLPFTLILMIPAWLLGHAGGIALGVVAASRHRSLLDNSVTFVSLFSYSLPTFWTAVMLLGLVALRLGWFPAGGMVDVRANPKGMARVVDIMWHLVLPVVAMAANRMAQVYRLTRTNMLEVMRQDYVRTARAKGLSERLILYRHALQNACLPVITVAGISMGYLVGGSVMVETVFAWPGMGRLTYQAIFTRDYPVMIGALLLISVAMILANLLTDIAYGLIDPRIRYS
jgi:peptide/nickel transport system permease protein